MRCSAPAVVVLASSLLAASCTNGAERRGLPGDPASPAGTSAMHDPGTIGANVGKVTGGGALGATPEENAGAMGPGPKGGAVVPDRPAAMTCYDGHSLWVNSRALAMAGITKDTPDPKNGVIVKDPKNGEPTGVLKESAQGLVRKVLPQPSRDDERAALPPRIAETRKVGLTSVDNESRSAEE